MFAARGVSPEGGFRFSFNFGRVVADFAIRVSESLTKSLYR
jgi:hypothetical protein